MVKTTVRSKRLISEEEEAVFEYLKRRSECRLSEISDFEEILKECGVTGNAQILRNGMEKAQLKFTLIRRRRKQMSASYTSISNPAELIGMLHNKPECRLGQGWICIAERQDRMDMIKRRQLPSMVVIHITTRRHIRLTKV